MINIPPPQVKKVAGNFIRYIDAIVFMHKFLNSDLRDAKGMIDHNFPNLDMIDMRDFALFIRDCSFEDLYRERSDNPLMSKRPRSEQPEEV